MLMQTVRIAAARQATATATSARAAAALASAAALYCASSSSWASEAAPSSKLVARKQPIEDDYTLGSKIGAGAYAHVLLGTCRKTGEQVAIKVIKKRGGTADEASPTTRGRPTRCRPGAEIAQSAYRVFFCN